ncbi:hypothetical protein SISSUDRAFT_1050107 [Sistotremastrum suecicum HHB10207 ss-3]|uniref:Uncharacterized protein n=1 Tax=Sistotremastrum suecicum HHB10207 ss-3 TaxID=1314776 RepID=A0A166BDJ9_9AGAM|nr:hypothetical protein SISSUDRAFT_1050107 [Sistotremastrum suecicum HHB10207 ss-3]
MELLATAFADPHGFLNLLLEHRILWGGHSLQGFVLWRTFTNFGPWIQNNRVTIELFCPLTEFQHVDAVLTSPEQGWERVKISYLTTHAVVKDEFYFISQGSCSTIWVYQKMIDGVRGNVVVADLGPCTSDLPFASFTRCCGMKVCRVTMPGAGALAFPGPDRLAHVQPHYLHNATGIENVEDLVDVEMKMEVGVIDISDGTITI